VEVSNYLLNLGLMLMSVYALYIVICIRIELDLISWITYYVAFLCKYWLLELFLFTCDMFDWVALPNDLSCTLTERFSGGCGSSSLQSLAC
jgi:hypothetical protein